MKLPLGRMLGDLRKTLLIDLTTKPFEQVYKNGKDFSCRFCLTKLRKITYINRKDSSEVQTDEQKTGTTD